MRFDFLNSIIAIGLSALIAYGFYEICDYDSVRWLLTIISGVVLAILGVFSIGLKPKAERTATNLKVLSGVMFAIMGVINFVFAFVNFNKPLFIILNGVCVLIYALVAVSIYRRQC